MIMEDDELSAGGLTRQQELATSGYQYDNFFYLMRYFMEIFLPISLSKDQTK